MTTTRKPHRPSDVSVSCPICGTSFWQRRTLGTPETCGNRCGQILRARRAGGGLTPRETQVHELIQEGLSNTEIARRLGIARGTVKNAAMSAYRKLGVTR